MDHDELRKVALDLLAAAGAMLSAYYNLAPVDVEGWGHGPVGDLENAADAMRKALEQ